MLVDSSVCVSVFLFFVSVIRGKMLLVVVIMML